MSSSMLIAHTGLGNLIIWSTIYISLSPNQVAGCHYPIMMQGLRFEPIIAFPLGFEASLNLKQV